MSHLTQITHQLILLLMVPKFSFEECVSTLNSIYNPHINCYPYNHILKCEYLSDISNNYGSEVCIEICNSTFGTIESDTFRYLPNLQYLSLCNNGLNAIETGAFDDLPALIYLNLSGNSIKTFTKGTFNAVNTIKVLDLSRNAIGAVESDFLLRMHNLKELYVNDNNISNISPFIAACDELVILDLSNNNIDNLQLDDNCSKLKYLKVAQNSIQSFTKNTVISRQLDVLDISNNKLEYIESKSFENLINLRRLNLSRNSLFKINDVPIDLFQNIILLRALNLSSTGIRSLNVAAFSPLEKLEVLDLSLNNLEQLPKDIFLGLHSLSKLYLNGNRLTNFECNTFSNFLIINLNDNLWNCNTLSDLATTLLSRKTFKIIHGNAYNMTNLLGIACYEETKNFHYAQNSLNFVDLQKEYLSFLVNDIKQTFTEIKEFLNQANLNEKNYSENYWKSLVEYQNSFKKLQNETQRLMLQIAITFGSLKNTTKLTESKDSTIHEDLKQTISELKSVLIQYNLVQKNYSIDYLENLKRVYQNYFQAIQGVTQQALFDIRDILNSSRSESQSLMRDSYEAKNSKITSTYEVRPLHNSDTVPLYCIFVVILAVFTLLLFTHCRAYKNSRNNHEERNPINTLQV